MTTYKDCSGNTKELDQFHYHEIVDRLHCLSEMWSSLITDHPACESVLGPKAEAVQKLIGECYQSAGYADFEFTGAK